MDEQPFGGRYALGEVLGSGGSGVVRLAHDTVLDRPVAIKLLKAGADDEVLRARLRAEAQLAGSLQHPGIAQIFDYGEADTEGDATPYIAMQYVEGTSLWSILRDRRTLPVEEVMGLVAQIARALQAAHDAGIVHRDLKPSNVLVTHEGRAVLVDFGIARSSDADPLTSTGTIVGTADYVSPEQCAGHSATALSDVYSLGMLSYECLTGHKPFHRESPVATALAHLNEPAPTLPDDVPDPVRQLVAAMVEKDPADRPSSAAEVAERAAALSGAVTDATRAMAVSGAAPVLPPPPTPARKAAVRTPPWRREALRSRRIQVSAAAVAVTVAVTVFVAARPSAPVVPDVDGLTWSEASALLEERGLEAEREPTDGSSADRGTVLGSEPEAGERVDDGTVVLSVASGRVVLATDDVAGLTYAEAARELVRLGLVPARRDVPRPGGDGTVVTAVPSGRMAVGTMVTLNVGTDEGVVPDDEGLQPSSGDGAVDQGGNAGKGSKPGKAKGKGNGKKH